MPTNHSQGAYVSTSTSTSRLRRLLALLAAPFLLLTLAGCGSVTIGFDVHSPTDTDVSFDFSVDSDTASMLGVSSADELCSQLSGDDTGGVGKVKYTPYEVDDGYGCRSEQKGVNLNDGSGATVTREGDELHLKLKPTRSGSDLSASDLSQVKTKVSFTFPGSVTSADGGGEIDGKTVTYTKLGDVVDGVDITAKAGGVPTWVWVVGIIVVVGGFLILVIAAIVFFVVRSRRAAARAAAQPGYPGQQGSQGQGYPGGQPPQNGQSFAGGASQPGGTGYPAGPSYPNAPGHQGAPSQPGSPSYPSSQPQGPSYPSSQPGSPAYPSSQPNGPSYPSSQPTYPDQGGQQGWQQPPNEQQGWQQPPPPQGGNPWDRPS